MIKYNFTVNIAEGLHARPCARLVCLLEPFQPVVFVYQDKVLDSLSVLDLLILKIPYGSRVTIGANTALPDNIAQELEKIFL